ncbi:MAG: acyltransferase, partial [Gammaproteobacteria bacterium]|nr:acyltransferase [Gammaproteobacteria bacterium]
PVSVMNFVEGTRFTDSKHARQESPYRHLLKPKPGGTAFVLEAMGEYIGTLVNVTIVYPQGRPGFWDFMCGKVQRVVMHVETTPIDATLRSRSFAEDPAYREAFKQWLGELWAQKDARIEQIRVAEGMPATPAREPV